MKRLLWLVLALSLAAVCLVASPPSPVSIDRASAGDIVTINVDFNYTGMVKETTGASYDAKPSSLSASDKPFVIFKLKEKWGDALGAGKVTVGEGAAGTGDLSVIVTDTAGPGTKYGNAGDNPAAAIVYEGFFRKEGFTGRGLINAIGETAAHDLGDQAGLNHTENKADLMSAGQLVPKSDREEGTRAFTPEQKDALKTWAKGREKSKPKASGKSTDIRFTPIQAVRWDFDPPDETAADLNLTFNGLPSGTQFGYMNIDNKFFPLGSGPIVTITDFKTPHNFAVCWWDVGEDVSQPCGDVGHVCDAATFGTVTLRPECAYPFGANAARFVYRCPSRPAGDVQLWPLGDGVNPFAPNALRNFPGSLHVQPATVFGAYPDDNLQFVGTGDFNGDGHTDLFFGTPYSAGQNKNKPGAGEIDIFFGGPGRNTFPRTLDLAHPGSNVLTLQPGNDVLRIFGSAPFQYLRPLAVGRMDPQSTADDFIIGAEGANANGPGSGAVYGVFGGPAITAGSFTIEQFLADHAANSFQIDGAPGVHLGRAATIGDVTGDGVADLTAGGAASDAPGPVPFAGNVYIYKGPFHAGINVGAPFASYHGDSANTYLGGLTPVIFNQNLIIQAPQADNVNGIDAGTVYALPLPLTGNTGASIGTAPVQIYGAGAGDLFGFGVAGIPAAGSTPGYLAVGAPGFGPYRSQPSDCPDPANAQPGVRCGAGAVYLFQSPLSGQINLANGGANFVIYGRARGDGINPFSAGDVNGDGLADLLISEVLGSGPEGASNNAGEGDVFFSSFFGNQALVSAADATPSTQVIDLASNPQSMTILGRDANDFLLCCKVADVNGDGLPDLLASAPYAAGPNNDRAAAGEAYVILSHPRGDVRCDGVLDAGDALGIARFSVGLVPAQPAQVAGSCTAIGAAGSDGLLQGDLNCDGVVNMTDALDDLRVFAGLSPLATAGPCPGPKAPVFGG